MSLQFGYGDGTEDKVGPTFFGDGKGNATRCDTMWYGDGKGNATLIYSSMLPVGAKLWASPVPQGLAFSTRYAYENFVIKPPTLTIPYSIISKVKNGITFVFNPTQCMMVTSLQEDSRITGFNMYDYGYNYSAVPKSTTFSCALSTLAKKTTIMTFSNSFAEIYAQMKSNVITFTGITASGIANTTNGGGTSYDNWLMGDNNQHYVFANLMAIEAY